MGTKLTSREAANVIRVLMIDAGYRDFVDRFESETGKRFTAGFNSDFIRDVCCLTSLRRFVDEADEVAAVAHWRTATQHGLRHEVSRADLAARLHEVKALKLEAAALTEAAKASREAFLPASRELQSLLVFKDGVEARLYATQGAPNDERAGGLEALATVQAELDAIQSDYSDLAEAWRTADVRARAANRSWLVAWINARIRHDLADLDEAVSKRVSRINQACDERRGECEFLLGRIAELSGTSFTGEARTKLERMAARALGEDTSVLREMEREIVAFHAKQARRQTMSKIALKPAAWQKWRPEPA